MAIQKLKGWRYKPVFPSQTIQACFFPISFLTLLQRDLCFLNHCRSYQHLTLSRTRSNLLELTVLCFSPNSLSYMAPKRRRVFPTTVRVDRISSLPDGVLSHILSFLTTEESVRTRVLSTRWKHLFSLVPVLHFSYYDRDLISCDTTSSSSTSSSSRSLSYTPDTSSETERIKRFLDFVDWVFASYNSHNMVRFYLSYYTSLLDASQFSSWISETVRRRVQELVLYISIREPQKLPESIFTCGTITCLSLDGRANDCLILDVPEDVCLPHVRKIDLEFVSFIDCDSARRLFRSCPVLEELKLQRAFSGDIYTLDICVPTLKKLTFFGGYEDNFNLVLNVPNVENFYCSGSIIKHGCISIESFKVLSKAGISVRAASSEGYKALEILVNAVCQVKKLQFDCSTLECFQRSGRSLPLFCNLTSLEIEIISYIDPEVLLDLLDRTPHLEVLKVTNGCYRYYDECRHHIHFPGERVPACVSLHLQEVSFGNFQMLESQFKMVDYLLKKAKVLNTFKIHFEGSLEKQVEMSKKLLAFSRWSRACQIELDLVTEDPEIEEDEFS